jgi:hypothetical protein
MKLEKLISGVGGMLLIKKSALSALEPKANTLNENIKNWLQNGELIQLKKGSYVLKDRFEKESRKDQYLEYLACALVAPSYISLEYVLSKYQMLSEPVQALTMVTSKSTREIQSKIAAFRYYSIADKLFTGYEIKYFQDAPYFQAGKEKALFDYIYLRFIKYSGDTQIALDNLRLNWENLNKKEFQKAASYLALSASPTLKKVFELIKKQYYA